MNYQLIRTDTKAMRIHKIPVSVKVEIYVAPELEPLIEDFHFEDALEHQQYRNRFINGELQAMLVKVVASAEGCTGIDSLGMCHIQSSCVLEDSIETVESHDMVSNAMGELRREILERANQLVRFAGSTA